MKSKEEILEGYFGSDYWLLKEIDDLQYILRAMDEYAKQKLQHGVSGKRPSSGYHEPIYGPSGIVDWVYIPSCDEAAGVPKH